MVYEIAWTSKAIESYSDNMEYLRREWTDKEIQNFTVLVEDKLEILAKHPHLGTPHSKMNESLRSTIINKRVSLIYRVKHSAKRIELILFWNTYQHAFKLKI